MKFTWRTGLILSVLAVLALLQWRFPYALQGEGAYMRVLYLLLLLMVIGNGRRAGPRFTVSKRFTYAGIWLAVIILLTLGYSYRDLLSNNRLMSELIPSRAQTGADGTLSVRTSQDGHFHIEGEVNGETVEFLVDTGASDIVLSPQDAERIGFDVDTLGYSRIYSTANGSVRGAPVRLNTFTLGPIALDNVQASVNQAPMDESLLGMEFLKRLKGYSVEGNTLTLHP